MSDLTYEQMMYETILTHVNCVVGVDVNFEHLPNSGKWATTEYEIGELPEPIPQDGILVQQPPNVTSSTNLE